MRWDITVHKKEMAKSDFICQNCNQVKSQKFFSLSSFHKYKCPNCGTICEDCVEKGSLFKKPRCKKCGQVVLKYTWDGKGWTKD